jgi:ribosomal protein S8
MNKKVIIFINILKNASLANKTEAFVPYNTLILDYVDCLYREGLLQSYEILFDSKKIKIFTRSDGNKILTSNLEFVSTLTKKRYLSCSSMKQVRPTHKEFIVCTDEGVFSLTECQEKNIGGLIAFSC